MDENERELIEKHCKKCKNHGRTDNYITCDFILKTGHSRGCPADLNCDKFRK